MLRYQSKANLNLKILCGKNNLYPGISKMVERFLSGPWFTFPLPVDLKVTSFHTARK